MSDTPRVTDAEIDGLITAAQYHRFIGTPVTVCCLTLRNGLNALGQGVCAADDARARGLALESARAKAAALEDYLRAQRAALPGVL